MKSIPYYWNNLLLLSGVYASDTARLNVLEEIWCGKGSPELKGVSSLPSTYISNKFIKD